MHDLAALAFKNLRDSSGNTGNTINKFNTVEYPLI